MGKVGGSPGTRFGLLQNLRRSVGFINQLPREGDVAHASGQDVVDVMGYPARQDTEGFEFLAPDALLLHRAPLCDVADDGAVVFPVVIFEIICRYFDRDIMAVPGPVN